MSKTKVNEYTVKEETRPDIKYVNLDSAIASLVAAKEYLIEKGCNPDSLTLDITIECDYGYDYVEVEAYGYRKETDKEKSKRLEQEAENKIHRKAQLEEQLAIITKELKGTNLLNG